MSEHADAGSSGGGGGGLNIKMLIIFGGVVLLMVVGSIAGTLYFTGFFSGEGAGGGHAPPVHVEIDYSSFPPIYMEIKPAFIVNALEGDDPHFVQVGVTVMARNKAALDAVNANLVAIRNEIREYLSGRPYLEVIGAVGINRVRAETEAAVKAYLEHHEHPVIDALYFTAFVVQ